MVTEISFARGQRSYSLVYRIAAQIGSTAHEHTEADFYINLESYCISVKSKIMEAIIQNFSKYSGIYNPLCLTLMVIFKTIKEFFSP